MRLFCELRVDKSSEIGARSIQELIILSRMRRRDMARSFDSGVGSSISDSVRLVSISTTAQSCSDAVPGEEWGQARSV